MMKKFVLCFSIILSMMGMSCSKQNRLVIMHFNDTHSQFLPFESDGERVGGVFGRAELINETRKKWSDFMVVDAGGFMTGSRFCSVFKGEMNIELMNMMGYDMIAVGNHELDYGLSNLIKLEEQADFPFLSANLLDKESLYPVFEPYIIKKIGNNRILFLGLTTSDWNVVNQYLKDDIILTDEKETLELYLREMGLAETNDIIILVSHAGYETDVVLAEYFTEIDVIFSGNGEFLTLYPQPVNETLILQAGYQGEYAGLLKLKMEDGVITGYDYELIGINETLGENQKIINYVETKEEIVEAELSTVIAESETNLDNDNIRNQSTVLGNLIADIILSEEKADLSIINAGGIRDSLPEGEIQIADIYEIYPYDNFLIRADIEGKYLRSAMKKGFKKRNEGGFLHYSDGVKVTLLNSGDLDVSILGEKITDDRIYNILITDFHLLGGDGYEEFTNCLNVSNTGKNIRDIIIEYIKNERTISTEDLDFEERLYF